MTQTNHNKIPKTVTLRKQFNEKKQRVEYILYISKTTWTCPTLTIAFKLIEALYA